MEDRKKNGKENNVTKDFREIIQSGKNSQRGKKTSQNTPQDNRDILSKAVNDITQESLIQGLIYSEIFGLPKCKRRGR